MGGTKFYLSVQAWLKLENICLLLRLEVSAVFLDQWDLLFTGVLYSIRILEHVGRKLSMPFLRFKLIL